MAATATTVTLGAGLALKPQHFSEARDCRDSGLWFEVHPENYLVDGGPRLHWLDVIRAHHPVALHGVSLSLAGEDPPDEAHLQRLAALARRIEPALVSEHLAWSRAGGSGGPGGPYLPDLLPFQRSTAALQRVAGHVAQVQDRLQRPIAIENPSHYLPDDPHHWAHSWDEVDFLTELVRRTGCQLLLDVNNVQVSAHNLGFSAHAYIDRFPGHAVAEIHVAGHSADPQWGAGLLIDSHDAPVAPPVWALLDRFVAQHGPRPVLLERDGNVPTFDTLRQESGTAAKILAHHAAALPLEATP